MAELEYFLVSESVAIDRDTNALSLFSVVEELHVVDLPALLPRLAAISGWLLEDADIGKDYQATVVVRRPDGSEFLSMALNFTASRSRQRAVMRAEGFPFDSVGTWLFELLLNGAHKASHRISVQKADPSLTEPTLMVNPKPLDPSRS